MPRTYVNRLLLTTLYRDLCSATEEHPVAQVDLPPDASKPSPTRRDEMRKLCFFPSSSYVGERDGFSLFNMPYGTEYEGWRLAVPRNRADRMWKGPTRALRDGYVVRYPLSHYAYPLIRGSEHGLIETDQIQRTLLDGLFIDWLPADSASHWVRVGGGHVVRVKLHGLCSQDRRVSISARVLMRDFWNDQFFDSTENGRVYLGNVHGSTMCRITSIVKGEIRDLATDGSPKAVARARNLGGEWFGCKCGYYGPADPTCMFATRHGIRCPSFSVVCPSCGSVCTPSWFKEMNRSIAEYVRASAEDGRNPFSERTPKYNVLRLGAKHRNVRV